MPLLSFNTAVYILYFQEMKVQKILGRQWKFQFLNFINIHIRDFTHSRMKFLFALLCLHSASAEPTFLRGAFNDSVSSTSSCVAPAGTGFCTATSTCSAGGGTSYAGYCAGAADIQCCIASCSTPSGSGSCEVTSSCSGTLYSGYCPGSSDVEVSNSLTSLCNSMNLTVCGNHN